MEDYQSLCNQAPENILKILHKNILEYSFHYFDHSQKNRISASNIFGKTQSQW